MVLKDLAEETGVEILVDDLGRAVIMHLGPLNQEYAWVQFDKAAETLDLVTESGDVQNLGLRIWPPFHQYLEKTEGVYIAPVDQTAAICGKPVFIGFVETAL